MKTRNNIQKTIKGQVKKMILRGSLVIFSLVLINLAVKANDFRGKFLNQDTSGKMALTMPDKCSESEMGDALFEAINTELAVQANKSTRTSVFETEVEEELEVEAWMTNENFFESAEKLTADGADQEVEKYAQKLIANQQNKTGNQVCNQLIGDSDEKELKVEAWMTNENFFESAEKLTADEADQEIEKYAYKLIDNQKSKTGNQACNLLITDSVEKELKVEAWMTNENFFESAEMLTADGADQEVEKYAQKLIANQQNKTGNQVCNQLIADSDEKELKVEAWMTNENFFESAEKLTADEADQEIDKYAQKLITQEENNTGK